MGGWGLRNTLILLDVHREVVRCDKRKRQRGCDRTSNQAQLVATGDSDRPGSRLPLQPPFGQGCSMIINRLCSLSLPHPLFLSSHLLIYTSKYGPFMPGLDMGTQVDLGGVFSSKIVNTHSAGCSSLLSLLCNFHSITWASEISVGVTNKVTTEEVTQSLRLH